MDADISAATTALDLDKIKAQDYRNELRDVQAARAQDRIAYEAELASIQADRAKRAAALDAQAEDRAAQRAMLQSVIDWAKAQYATLPEEETATARLRREVFLALVAKYMTTGTAVDPALVADDARKDVARLSAAWTALEASGIAP